MAFDIQNFPPNEGVILACHITGFHDVNRNTTLVNDHYELVKAWAESVVAAGLKGIIFHNNFSEQTCERFQNESIAFMRVEHDPRFNQISNPALIAPPKSGCGPPIASR